jgi:hypothetical protein
MPMNVQLLQEVIELNQGFERVVEGLKRMEKVSFLPTEMVPSPLHFALVLTCAATALRASENRRPFRESCVTQRFRRRSICTRKKTAMKR